MADKIQLTIDVDQFGTLHALLVHKARESIATSSAIAHMLAPDMVLKLAGEIGDIMGYVNAIPPHAELVANPESLVVINITSDKTEHVAEMQMALALRGAPGARH